MWDIPRGVAFTDVAWVYSIRSHLWLFMTVVILLLSWMCLSSLRSPRPFAIHVPHWCGVCPSALVHSCHMAFPFPLQILNYCYDVLCVGTLFYVRIRHSVASYNLQYYLLHFPLTSLEHSLFLFLWATMFGRRILDTLIRRDSRTAFFVSSFRYLLASINPRLLNLFQAIAFFFSFLTPVVPER